MTFSSESIFFHLELERSHSMPLFASALRIRSFLVELNNFIWLNRVMVMVNRKVHNAYFKNQNCYTKTNALILEQGNANPVYVNMNCAHFECMII